MSAVTALPHPHDLPEGPLQRGLNPIFDRAVRVQVRLFGRRLPAFRVAGVFGLAAAVVLSQALVLARGLSPWVMLAVSVAAVVTFLGLAMAVKILSGRETLVYYHHEIAVLLVSSGLLWALRQPLLAYLDATLLGVGAFLACGRVGCWLVGCCHGRPSRWGACYRAEHVAAGFPAEYAGVRLFPIQLVECTLALVVVYVGSALVFGGAPAGAALAWYTLAYGLGRYCLEFWRGDAPRRYFAGASEAQWISLALVGAAAGAGLAGWLPVTPWHLAATVLLGLVTAGLAALRRLRPSAGLWLLQPAHVRELLGAARLGAESGDGPHIHTTSLGLQVSAGLLPGGGALYAFSIRRGGLTLSAARALAETIRRVRHPGAEAQFLAGRAGVFQLLILPVKGLQ